MTPANLVAWFAQVALLVALCAGLPRLLGLRSPVAHYVFWRALLAVCLALPLVQPWRTHILEFVPAAAPAGSTPIALAQAAPSPPVAAASAIDWATAIGAIVLAGIALRLLWIALGAFRLRSLRRRAAADPVAGVDELQSAIGTRAEILWSSDVAHPVTFGVVRPVVLVPVAVRTADGAAQRAVLAHELHHVKRRDWLWVVGEEIVRSVFWFHPAVWWLVSRIQLARETVVDELSILATNARRTYLDTLLAFADDTGLASPPAFSARRHLFYRVMLLSKEGGMSSIRVALASLVLTIALGAGAWGAVSAFPLYGEPQIAVSDAQQAEPATPFELHRRAVELQDKARLKGTLSADERLNLIATAIRYEDRVLENEPNHVGALVYKNILLRLKANLTADPHEQTLLLAEADELRSRAIALQRAGIRSPDEAAGAPPPPPPPAPPYSARRSAYAQLLEQYQPVRIGGTIRSPQKTRDVKPAYPPIARSARVQGIVIIEILVDGSGNVVDGQVLRSIPLLDEAAMDAVRQWRFVPTLKNGTPTPVVMTVTVNFSLQ